ncbi:hypothetical protein CJ030_MR0G025174 [Morella rubra]|uniref:RNase H type-1 domain-containing protein n=1 Tax=Morella rubra TaxID=262757 RepID=A0A6A1UFK8_9ROSI|nr:hypothetical protein CJ030_MR0G025211 [Morella rubra]KAB1199355.1 hypothetical protein CJ030_MR0G025174 [Morella rubra]
MSCRDSSSSLCAVYIDRINAMDPLLGEAIAVSTAMTQASRLGWRKVVFECDSLLLVTEINSKPDPPLWSISTQVSASLEIKHGQFGQPYSKSTTSPGIKRFHGTPKTNR